MECSFTGCGRRLFCAQLCRSHYRQKQQGKDLRPINQNSTHCSVAGCERQAEAKNLCMGHYAQKRRGKPLTILQHRAPAVSRDSLKGLSKSSKLSHWAARNPEKYLKYRKTRNQVVPNGESIDRNLVFEMCGGMCYLCGQEVSRDKWDLDHIQPISKGGEHAYDNVAVTHPSCNRRKNNMTIIEYMNKGVV